MLRLQESLGGGAEVAPTTRFSAEGARISVVRALWARECGMFAGGRGDGGGEERLGAAAEREQERAKRGEERPRRAPVRLLLSDTPEPQI